MPGDGGRTMMVMQVGIASFADFKARTMAIARGERRLSPDDPKVRICSTEGFARMLTAKSCDLLATISKIRSRSLAELAEHIGRATSNLSVVGQFECPHRVEIARTALRAVNCDNGRSKDARDY